MALLHITDLATDIRLRSATVHAVDGINLAVDAGETVGLVGESGSGKTMTAMSIMGLLPPGGKIVRGSIELSGRNLVGLSDSEMRAIRGNEIGMVFQDPMTSLNPTMTIGEQVAESVRWHRGATRPKAWERAVEVLDLVGIPQPRFRAKAYPHELSGGMRQRVMIAMALACEPRVLIADEPTTALDVTIQAQILDLLDRLKAELGMAMVLVTHDMGIIAGRADRVMVMYAGQVVEKAPTTQLFTQMRHPYTEALLASIPQLDYDVSQPLYSIPGLPPDLAHPTAGCRFAPRCKYATDQCRTTAPVLVDDGEAASYACFHPRDTLVADVKAGALVGHGATPPAASWDSDADIDLAPGSRRERISESVLELRAVHKTFAIRGAGVRGRSELQAVHDVSLTIHKGEAFGIVGESGCGKTTLGRMIVDLDEPTAGEIIVGQNELRHQSGRRRRSLRRDLQMMFQDPYASLDPRMRVGSIIAEPLVLQKVGDRRSRERRVAELMAEVGLPASARERYPHEFSGGQRQRIGLARALALNPKVIVADEPVSALDVSIRSQILNLMRKLQAAHDLTYIVISHDLSVVRYLADRIGVMYLGALVEVGRSQDVYSRPAHPYTAALLQAIPLPDPSRERIKTSAPLGGEPPSPVNPPSGCRFRTRCPRAKQVCADTAPALSAIGGLHSVACHFPLQQSMPASTSEIKR